MLLAIILDLFRSVGFWMLQIFIWLDQGVNVVLFFGYADETISARAYRQRHLMRWWVAMQIIDFIFAVQGDHCRKAFESERKRLQSPDAERS